MRLALVTNNRLPPREGVGRHVLETGRRLAARGHEVRLVARGRGPRLHEGELDGLPLLEYPDFPIPPPLHHLAARAALGRWLRAGADGAELLHLHLPLLPPLPRQAPPGLPLVVTVHSPMLTDSAAIGEPGLRPALLRLNARLLSWRFERHHLARADRVIAVSNGVKDELQAAYGVRAGVVEVVPNGVDTGFVRPAASPGGSGGATAERDSSTILYAGRLGYRKGLGRLLEAFALLAPGAADLELALAGEGPLAGSLARQARDLGIAGRVRFLGFLDREALRAAYRSAACVVNPADYESGPLTLLEAMATGTPVVSTRTGLARELGPRPPILLARPDPRSLATVVQACLADPESAVERAERARALVERAFDWERVVDRLEAVYGVQRLLAA